MTLQRILLDGHVVIGVGRISVHSVLYVTVSRWDRSLRVPVVRRSFADQQEEFILRNLIV